MGRSLIEVQLPVGVPERVRQHWADMLSQITTHLSPEVMQSVLDRVSLVAAHRAEGYDPAVVEGNYGLEKEVCATIGWVLVEMHMTDWAKTQREDPVLNAVLDWLDA